MPRSRIKKTDVTIVVVLNSMQSNATVPYIIKRYVGTTGTGSHSSGHREHMRDE